MFLQIMLLTFFIPILSALITCVFNQSSWTKCIHIIVRIVTILALYLLSLIIKPLGIFPTESSFAYKCFIGITIGLWTYYWMNKSGLNQKNCQTK
ncbi:MAG: hypothetical protein NTU89_03580 [Candidatus Dependentiae bacterium]|nr:hypothetical protein [Candidatus Dependentiae bacterium]